MREQHFSSRLLQTHDVKITSDAQRQENQLSKEQNGVNELSYRKSCFHSGLNIKSQKHFQQKLNIISEMIDHL